MRIIKSTPFLDAHNKYIKTGFLPALGLCNVTLDHINVSDSHKFLKLISPTYKDRREMVRLNYLSGYWGCDLTWNELLDKYSESEWQREKIKCYKYNPLRQTLMLLMAALNDEL